MSTQDNVKGAARIIEPASILHVRGISLSLARVAFVVLLAFGISGCGRDKATDHSEGTAPPTGATATDTAEKSQESSPAVSADDTEHTFPTMPEDVPLYPSAGQTTGTRVGEQTVGSWKTTDTPDVVVAFYAEQLPGAGWTIDKNEGSALGATMEASKEGRKLMVAITRALPQGTVVNLSHRP